MQNVLYLMIVNLPTEEEITASTSMAAEERKRQGRDLMGMMQDFY